VFVEYSVPGTNIAASGDTVSQLLVLIIGSNDRIKKWN
jgi:hypothetical protein